MGGFAFQVACLRLLANEPLVGVYSVPVDWPALRQNLRVVEVHMCSVYRTRRAIAELRSSFVRSSLFFGCLLVSRECSFILSATDLEVSPTYTVVQSWHESL